MKAAIIGNGTVGDYEIIADEIKKCDLIICADGGIRHLFRLGISPDVFIGDFDSCNFEDVRFSELLKNAEIVRYNPMKDDTDMQLCIDCAIERKCDEIILFAALGGRVDHELSNIFHLKYMLDKGVCGAIFSEKNRIYITDSHFEIEKQDGFKLSVIPLTSSASGITLKGLLYPLENASLIQGTSLGISNEFLADTAEISVKSGVLLVFLSRD